MVSKRNLELRVLHVALIVLGAALAIGLVKGTPAVYADLVPPDRPESRLALVGWLLALLIPIVLWLTGRGARTLRNHPDRPVRTAAGVISSWPEWSTRSAAGRGMLVVLVLIVGTSIARWNVLIGTGHYLLALILLSVSMGAGWVLVLVGLGQYGSGRSGLLVKADGALGDLYQHASAVATTYAWLTVLGGLSWALLLLLESGGTLLDDEVSHVVIARDAWRDPTLILNVWGRTANTLVFMPVAPFGLTPARVFALALSCVIVLLTVRLARHLDVEWPWVTPLLLLFQPWFAQWSFQAVTEIPFTLFMIAGWVLLFEEHLIIASLAIGLLPLIRHEGILLLGLWVALIAWRRQWVAALAGPVPLVVYNLVSYLTTGFVPASIYFAPKPTDLYGSGGWFHYALPLLDGVGIPVLLLAVLGLPAMVRRSPARLFLAWNAIYVAMQVVIFRFGLFASGGYLVFLLPVAPLVAIMAAHGLRELLSRIEAARLAPRIERAAGALLILTVTVLVVKGGLAASPIPRDPYQTPLEEAASWVRDEGLNHSPVVATHIWFYYYLPLRVGTPEPPLAALPVGTVLVWDSKYSELQGWTLAELSDPDNGWELLQQFGGDVRIYRKDLRAPASAGAGSTPSSLGRAVGPNVLNPAPTFPKSKAVGRSGRRRSG